MSSYEPKFNTLTEIFEHSSTTFGNRELFGTKSEESFDWITYRTFCDQVNEARAALADAGIQKGDRVAVIANNRPEWAVVAYAVYGLGAAYVPMYESQLDKDWKFILENCGAKILFVANEEIEARILALRDSLSTESVGNTLHPKLSPNALLETIITFDKGTSNFSDFLSQNLPPLPMRAAEPDDIAGFIYTSGTTGAPKGVLLSHSNLAKNVSAIHEFFPIGPEDRSLSFLPWAHSFGQTVELHALFSMGASMGIAEATHKIIENLAEVRPTLLISVPRIFNRIYDGLNKRMTEEAGLKKRLFDSACRTTRTQKALRRKGRRSGWVDLKQNLLDKLVFSKVRERFGGRLKYAFSGGAALSKEVAEFIDDLGIMVYEGYGLTETSPIATANSPRARKIGSVGKAIPGITIDIDTSMTDEPEQGEIVIYGHNVMQGYFGLEDENKKALTTHQNGERGFRSGDMGYVDSDGFLHITGRIKEKYKLLNGKYVVPTPLEEQIKLSPFVNHVMVYGMNQNYNIAVIIPDFDTLNAWAKEQGIRERGQALIDSPQVVKRMQKEVDAYSSDFKQYEKVRNLVLGSEEFSPDNGMLTPTLKLKRRVVLKHYQAEIDALYASKQKH